MESVRPLKRLWCQELNMPLNVGTKRKTRFWSQDHVQLRFPTVGSTLPRWQPQAESSIWEVIMSSSVADIGLAGSSNFPPLSLVRFPLSWRMSEVTWKVTKWGKSLSCHSRMCVSISKGGSRSARCSGALFLRHGCHYVFLMPRSTAWREASRRRLLDQMCVHFLECF